MDAKTINLTDIEILAILFLINQLPSDQSAQMLQDFHRSRLIYQNDDNSILMFIVDGYDRPKYDGQHAYATEGSVKDEDGVEISVCLYGDQNDRLLEFELIKWDGSPMRSINWQTFKIVY